MEIVLIRHGLPQRVENVNGVPADPPLSTAGQSQARLLALALRNESFDRLYSSPMRRAFETAQPLAAELGMEILTRDGVAEYDRDSQAYIPMEELKLQDYDRWKAFSQRGYGDKAEFLRFSANVVATLEQIISENRGKKVAVVCHGGVINVWSAHVIGLAPKMFFNPDYTSINRYMAASSGERSVITLNQAMHLQTR